MFRKKKGRRNGTTSTDGDRRTGKSSSARGGASRVESSAPGAGSSRACGVRGGGDGSSRREAADERPDCDDSDSDSNGNSNDDVDELLSLVPPYLRPILHHYHGDFFATAHTDPQLFVQVMAEGFLPIACKYGPRTLVLPKLHEERCVVCPLSDHHVPRSVRKKAKRYEMTINRDFDLVVEACHRQHGMNWLYPPVVESFRAIHSRGGAGMDALLFDDSAASAANGGPPVRPVGSCPVRLYSVEVRSVATGDLVAGELGYTVGSVYTSLTGFTAEDGAGSVQLAALGTLLGRCGFDVWDLGMDMDYKGRLGARLMPRAEFVRTVRRVRGERPDVRLICGDGRHGGGVNCKDIIIGEETTAARERCTDEASGKKKGKAKGEDGPTAKKGAGVRDGAVPNRKQKANASASPKRRKHDLDRDVSGQCGLSP